ncbi:TolC family protein [Novosphingobium sp.]|uniref:TolC family protein n=1 Tax=Novosphingobium sp. TaxID=1874826 RepID=UPI0028A8E7A8|nr:TolC family protein [Novosphingobium sp.]
MGRAGIFAMLTVIPTVAFGQVGSGRAVQDSAEPAALSFEAARQRLDRVSSALGAAADELSAAEYTAHALKALNRPVVSSSVSVIAYQKSLSVDLTGQKDSFSNAAGQFLEGLPGEFPPEFSAIVQQVSGRVAQALPGLLSQLPDELDFRARQTVIRPNVTAVMPLYSGGAIPAIQRGAEAGAELARAKQAGAQDLSQVRLVQSYFGQQLAQALLTSATGTRDAFDKHLANAQALFREGVIPRSRVLEVQVARDAAQRAVERATMEERSASDSLARLLDAAGGVAPTTPLFVNGQPLEPLDDFLATAASPGQPQMRVAEAARHLADSGVDLAKSRMRPQAFAFGSYNFNRSDAIPVDPDWIVGMGVRFTLLSNIDRRDTLAAAHARQSAADNAARDARKTIEIETSRAYNLTETARRSFLLLDSNIKAAEENLRVHEIGFREGEDTASQLIDARNALSLAQTQRIASAYEYVVALSALLVASNRGDNFRDYLLRADRIAAP